MSEQAVLTRPAQDEASLSAQLQERVRGFTSFYEQHAYLAYNLALRVTGASQPAMHATQRGFLRELAGSEDGLVASTVQAALEEARAEPDPSEAGDAEAQRLLSAMAALAPAERAAVAVADLAHGGPETIADVLGIPAEQATKLLHRGREGLAERLGVSRAAADRATGDWMWAAPPNEIWEATYAEFHRAVERELRDQSVEATIVRPAADAGGSSSRRTARSPRRPRRKRDWLAPLRWLRRRSWSVVVPLVALLAIGGVAAAMQLTGGSTDPQDDVPASSVSGAVPTPEPSESATGDKSPKPRRLTPELLDKLRLRELKLLNKYAKRQTDLSLPARQRRAAARRVAELRREAQLRLRAERRREAAIRQQQEREARQRARTQAPPPPTRETSPTPPRETERRSTPTETPSGSPPQSQEEAESTCLQDQDTGQYICQQ